VSVVCVVRGLCDGAITHLEDSYRAWCMYVNVSVIKEPHRGGIGPLGLSNHEEKNNLLTCLHLSWLHSNVLLLFSVFLPKINLALYLL